MSPEKRARYADYADQGKRYFQRGVSIPLPRWDDQECPNMTIGGPVMAVLERWAAWVDRFVRIMP
jgi:hypothetical protein